MLNQKGYFDLLDWLESERDVKPQQFFQRMQSEFGIAHLLYIDVSLTPVSLKLHRLHHTFSPRVVQAVAALGSALLANVTRAALDVVRPLDWKALADRVPRGVELLQTANLPGLPYEGMIYPLVSRDGRAALLAIQVPAYGDCWLQYRRMHDRDIHALAALFHGHLLERETIKGRTDAPHLTQRELEALGWSAAGKSYWEISVILGISERTVRFFMANARSKLNAVSNAQAVAEAVWQGLISHH